MHADKPDNPSAFPCQALGTDGLPCCEADAGMSLRDYFAAHAPIQIPCGFPSGPTIEATPQGSQADTTPWISWTDAERLVKWRWHYADVMLKERGKATP